MQRCVKLVERADRKKHIHKNNPPKPLPTKHFRARRRNFCEYLYLHMSGAHINLHPIQVKTSALLTL